MRQTKCSLELKERIFAVVAIIVLASSLLAGLGTYRNTLTTFKGRLASAGWKVGVVYDRLADRNNQAPSEHSVNQTIGEVLKKFSNEDADKISLETKREVSRIAREAIAEGFKDKRTNLRTGITGSLRYRVGVFKYTRYYVPGKGEYTGGGDQTTGLAPIIALLPKDPVPMKEAKIRIINVPADAELFFDGEATTQKGYARNYTTAKLEVGKMYSYKILVRWQKDGKTRERSRTVSLSGGDDDIKIDFRIYGGVAKD